MIQSQAILPGFPTERQRGRTARHGFEHLRRDRHRRWSQRTHERRVLRAPRRSHGRAREPRQDRRRRRYQRSVHRSPRHQRHHLQLRDVADAADDHPRAEPEAPRLRRDAVRPVLPGLPRRAGDHGLRRRREEELRVDRAVLEEGRRHAPEMGGVDEGCLRRARPAAAERAAACGLDEARRPAPADADRVEHAQARAARRGRCHAAVHDERDRPARRLVRVRRDQGDAHGQRRDRHVGRPRRARHRLRDAAPLDRRRRRRPSRQLGLPAGRHGRGERLDPPQRRVVRL